MMAARPKRRRQLSCAACGKGKRDRALLIDLGRYSRICDQCVVLCREILDYHRTVTR